MRLLGAFKWITVLPVNNSIKPLKSVYILYFVNYLPGALVCHSMTAVTGDNGGHVWPPPLPPDLKGVWPNRPIMIRLKESIFLF